MLLFYKIQHFLLLLKLILTILHLFHQFFVNAIENVNLCDAIIEHNKEVQALIVNGTTLYLVVDNQLYSLPLATTSTTDDDSANIYVRSSLERPRIVLYNQKKNSVSSYTGFQSLGLWNKAEWFKISKLMKLYSNESTTSQPHLRFMNIFHKVDFGYIHLVYSIQMSSGDDNDVTVYQNLINLATGENTISNSIIYPYSIFTDDTGQGFLIQIDNSDGVSMILNREPYLINYKECKKWRKDYLIIIEISINHFIFFILRL